MRASLGFRWVCISFLACTVALAEPNDSAREHFARGLEQAGLGDFDAAAANFEEAYRLSPHYAVLYNLGQAYASVGKSIEASRAFEMYLQGGGQKIAPERQTQVRQLIQLSKKRIGYVSFEIEPAGAQLLIDGRAIDTSRLGDPTSLIVGVHSVRLTLTAFEPYVGTVSVESQKLLPLKLKLEPISVGAPADLVRVGQVAVDSALPELETLLDGTPVERLGKDPFIAPLGRHRIQCQRDGYDPIDIQIDVGEKGVVRVACDLTPASRLQPSELGMIGFSVDQPGAEVLIDGHRVPSTTRLPKGSHFVRIRRWGFIDWTRTVTARPGFPETFAVELEPTPEHALEIARAKSKRRNYAYVLGGTGIALLGTSAALYVTNNDRYQMWAAQRREGSPETGTAVSIQRQDDAALGAAVAGGLLLGLAAISRLSSK